MNPQFFGSFGLIPVSRDLWKKVGLVFQYPEHQIFQTTVFDEVAYGPRNLKLPEPEVKERVYEALEQVGLPRKTLLTCLQVP